jgi:hypothetical protein
MERQARLGMAGVQTRIGGIGEPSRRVGRRGERLSADLARQACWPGVELLTIVSTLDRHFGDRTEA